MEKKDNLNNQKLERYIGHIEINAMEGTFLPFLSTVLYFLHILLCVGMGG